MTRKRFDSAPHINVKDEGMLIQQVAGSTTNLLEVKSHSGATLMAVDYAGTMTSGASNTFTYLAATTSASLPANTTIGAVSSTELGYLDGVTSAIQTQLDAKAPLASPTFTGTVTLPTGTVTSGMILDGTIVNGDINSAAAIALSKLASGIAGQVVVANASGVPTYVTLSGDVTVDATGATTIAANSVALGTDTTGNYVASLVAGTGITLANNTGEGATPTITNSGVTGLTGTANQITVSASTGSVTLSLPQNIHTSASPTFSDVSASHFRAGATGLTDAGSVSATNWFRSTGGSGWYNNTYGGGIWMQDSTWVRVYGSKNFYCDSELRANRFSGDGTALYGSYGSVSITGAKNGYSGFDNDTTASAFMWTNNICGHYYNNSAWNWYFDRGTLRLMGDSYYMLSYVNQNSAQPWHYGPYLQGYNGWSYFGAAAGQWEMGHRHATGTGHIYAWIRGGLIIGSTPNDTMAGTATLTIAGSAAKSSGGTSWAIYSDERFKENIELYEKGLAEIVSLVPKSFVFNGKNATIAGEESVGLIAQDVQHVFPDAVSVAEFDELDDIDNPLLLNFNEIQFAMINAIKELNNRITELENAN